MISEFFELLSATTALINILFAIVVVFFERKNPSVTWAWLMLVLIVPYIGFIVYLIFGLESKKVRVFAFKAKQDESIHQEYIDSQINGYEEMQEQLNSVAQKSIAQITGSTHFDDIVYLNLVSGNGLYTTNNAVEMYHEGKTKFDALIRDIENAKSFVHLQYYIFKGDELGQRVIDALCKKVKEGIEVKVLIDGMGSPKKIFKHFTACGGELAVFLPPRFVRMNYRNHRKLAIIDGTIGYIGGLNIGNEYLGITKRFGYWRDCHLRISGDAVRQMEIRFFMDWNFSSHKKFVLSNKYFVNSKEKYGNTGIQIVSSGPDTKWYSIVYALSKMINEADHSIYIQTPYFVPDDNILESLRIAALAGKDVRIMIPGKPDHPFVYGAAMSYLGELLQAGVKCYQYERGFVHSKLVIIDSIISTVGTANMDVRSFKLNFEVNSFVYNEEISTKLEAQFLKDLDDCTEITAEFYHNRTRIAKIKESISRLLSPLL